MSASNDDTILPQPRKPSQANGLDGETLLPSNNTAGIHNPGDLIDNRYTVIREIGRGGMGVVYEVLDALTDDHYAVKRLLPFFASRPEIVKQFWSEGAASMRFTNQSRLFVTTQTVGQDQGLPYIVMELVSYPTLRAIMNKTGAGLVLNDALSILKAVAASLAELHSMGYIHRDLKPENIFISEHAGNVTAFLSDFGLTKDGLASTATVMKGAGTERYASPEQKKGLPTTPATDVYAFGVIAYEMLTGELPAYGDDISNYVNSAPQSVVNLINDCLTARPERRPANGNAIVLTLSDSAAERPSAPPKLVVEQPVKSAISKGNQNAFRKPSRLSRFPELSKYIDSMCNIPADTFKMGSLSGRDDEKPVHSVTLSSYFMGATPVTVAMWKEYCTATGRKLPKAPSWGWLDEHPVVNVSWDDIMGSDGASGFCAWVCALADRPMSLPTEAQWEYAACGGVGGQEFPWGNNFDRKMLWCSDKKYGDAGKTAPVIRSTRIYLNPYGLTDMAGNVSEWCSDFYAPYASNLTTNPAGPSSASDNVRCIRGGSWYSDYTGFFRCAFRNWYDPCTLGNTFGFRLAVVSN